jgi:hypothetical protein
MGKTKTSQRTAPIRELSLGRVKGPLILTPEVPDGFRDIAPGQIIETSKTTQFKMVIPTGSPSAYSSWLNMLFGVTGPGQMAELLGRIEWERHKK